MAELNDKRVAIVVDTDFEQAELTGPMEALKQAGAKVDIISSHDKVQGMNHDEKADTFDRDVALDEADLANYDAMVLPGGAINADSIRMDQKVKQAVKQFMESGKPLAVICHAPWVLVSAGVVKGKKLTSWPTIQDDIRNAGGEWVDEQVVVDGNLITSRKPDDVPAFNKALMERLTGMSGGMASTAATA